MILLYFIKKKEGKIIEGIKQIPSYICKMPYDKLNELREKFWKNK